MMGAAGPSPPPPRGGGGGRNANTAMLLGAVAVGTLALSYAAVPLYRMFCSGMQMRRVKTIKKNSYLFLPK